MNKLHLIFIGDEAPSLSETLFVTSNGTTAHTVRGKLPGAFRAAGTFQWTSAVKALSFLFVCYRCAALNVRIEPVLCGARGSPALSLDYAIAKETLWLSDMFGMESSGVPAAKLLFLRSNSNLRRPGPVAVTVNERRLPPDALTFLLNGRQLTEVEDLQRLMVALQPETYGLVGPVEHPLKALKAA